MLTLQQRASRRTKKNNNAVQRALPLFANTPAIEQFLTTEDAQLKAVKRWDEITARYFEQLEQSDHDFIVKATLLRSQVCEEFPERFIEFEAKLDYLIANYSAYKNNPAYIADYWQTILKTSCL